MIQEIITYIIIFSAFAYAGYSFVKIFIPPAETRKKITCGNNCSACSLKYNKNKKGEYFSP